MSDREAIIISRAHQLKRQRAVSINSAFFFHSHSISQKKKKKWRKGGDRGIAAAVVIVKIGRIGPPAEKKKR